MFLEQGKTGIDDGWMIDFSGPDINSVIFDKRKLRFFWEE